MKRFDIINQLIAERNYTDYLEIGVQDGQCYKRIKCKNKTGVDPDPETKKKYVPECIAKTSDEFFKSNTKKFDLVFIDGLHHYQQVFKDINNSLRVLKPGGTIVCHDMLPPDEAHQIVPRIQPEWTGDCWKAWVILRGTRTDLKMFVINTDYGCGIIRPGKQETIYYQKLDYSSFVKNKKEWMNIVEKEEVWSAKM